ncbi:MAG TPA: hypothetical protein VEB21_14805, partial [Terriglobales bacterium]|nr:hypothetical protein [Terriglobales bacterium]
MARTLALAVLLLCLGTNQVCARFANGGSAAGAGDFVAALSHYSFVAAAQAHDPTCAGDCDGDGSVDEDDVERILADLFAT